ncbi:MAG: efflux RND transporter permease subunit [Bacteroidales bacterium]|jgi:multidrug efflux pump subunit AcrB|nr:efflux RND transporter permease subunit [Bacteroidales bacterium]
MHISEYFFQKKTIFWCLIFAIVVGGIYSFIVMPKLEDPEIAVKQAMIITPYMGASAYEVELEVTSIIEEELRTMNNIQDIQSHSSENISSIAINLEYTVSDKDIEQRWDMLRRKVQNAADKLPSGAMAPIVVDDVSDVYGMFYALTADGYSYAELEKYARFLKRELLEVKGVRRIELFGAWDECIDIVLAKENIAQTGIFPMQIMSAIDGRNKPVSIGAYESGDKRIRLAIDGKFRSVEDVQNLMISTPKGEQVRLKEIADVTRTYTDPQTYGFWVDSKPAIAISISMEPDAVVTQVGKRTDRRLAELADRLPAGFEYTKIYFQPDKVSDAISSFMINLVESVVIVILVLMLTMGFRSGVIIGIGLLLTVLATFPLLLAAGGTLQRISLGAFIVAMGMLVDNAVVIMDGILVDRGKGKPPRKALFDTAKNTAIPLLGATIIAISTFLVVFLSDDSAGTYARDLFLVLCISLLLSWVLALTQVPMFAAILLPSREKRKDVKEQLDRPIHRGIRKLLTFFMRHKTATVSVSLSCLLLAALGFFKVKNLFFPDFEYEQLYIEYTLPPQTGPDRIKEDIHEITGKLLNYEEVKRVAASQGRTPSRYCLVRATNSVGDNYGEFIVNFKDYKTANRMRSVIEKELRSDYPDAYVRARKYNFSIATSHRIEVLFSGPDPALLRELSRQGQEIMRNCVYTDTYSVCDNWQMTGKSLYAHYDQQAAGRAGITRSDVGNAMSAATDGLPIGLFSDNDKSLLINLKIRDSFGNRIKDLKDIPVWGMMPNISMGQDEIMGLMNGSMSVDDLTDEMFRTVPLSQVTLDVEPLFEETVVYRYNGQRSIKVQCEPDETSTPAAVKNDIFDAISQIELPEGYTVQWLGEQKMQKDAMVNIFKYIPVVALLILLVLLLLFNDLRKLFLVLFCLPFALVGITPVLLITGTPFTFMAILGLMGLVGMMIKNMIVLIDEITRRTKEGTEPYEAIIASTVNRTRPVVMASATTILGVLPLVFDPMYSSLAIAIMSGLTVGTIITLILLPIFYSVLFKIKNPQNA